MMDTYEKKYNEALERAKEMCTTPTDMATMEYIFPELRESEDERIRKEIIEFIQWAEDRGMTRHDYHQAKRPAVWVAYLEKQEQKPAEKQDYSGLTDFERAIHRGFLCAGVENVPRTIIKETAQDCLAHLPAEWSEEDEAMRDSILRVLQCFVGTAECVSVPSLSTSYPLYQREIEWLKSLRPSWKPSEEQMKALESCFCEFGEGYPDEDGLRSLYNDLRKLMSL